MADLAESGAMLGATAGDDRFDALAAHLATVAVVVVSRSAVSNHPFRQRMAHVGISALVAITLADCSAGRHPALPPQ